ncbi:hypothetical protein AMATHDRAFT_11526 [Amanita thiersii Skay4041]|uniref:Uncharacterized protein n=1 Tax=Amanita thiersii Skay4041 TaxID=703135 RepID=A0A2A9NA33_9AGAR|nr:hypothetical protein AMATHDRAFT_11526 [Amanita thiersii Skay4041]
MNLDAVSFSALIEVGAPQEPAGALAALNSSRCIRCYTLKTSSTQGSTPKHP